MTHTTSHLRAALDPEPPADASQSRIASIIIAVGAAKGLTARGHVIAVATAMQESSLRNLLGGNADSIGVFQQRPSQGWGTPPNCDPSAS